MNEEDKRVIKTRKLIRTTFIELLDQKPFEKITATEIAEKAMISKATFYYHYEDKYDLINKMTDELIAEYKDALNIIMNEEQRKQKSDSFARIYTQVLSDYEHIRRINMTELDYREKLQKLLAAVMKKVIQQKKDMTIKDIDIVSKIIASTSLSLADALLDEHKTSFSIDDNVEIMHEIIRVENMMFPVFKQNQ